MITPWPEHTLEECMDSVIDYRGKTPKKQNFGIPLVTAKIIKDGRIETPTEFIAIDEYDNWMRRGIPKPGDVVLTTEAPLGEVAQLGSEKIALAQRVITLRGKKDFLDNTFLRYLLQSNYIKHQLESRATGTTVLGIKQSELRKVLLPIPSVETQKAIAHILGTLDDKIELNRQTNKTLEAIAKAIFKSWFVDFDPVHYKQGSTQQNRKSPNAAADEKSASTPNDDPTDAARYSLSPEILDLFPGSFQDSELGEIPAGWAVDTIAMHSSIKHGYAFKGEHFSDTATPEILVTPGNFKIGGGFKLDKLKYYSGPFDSEYRLNAGDLVVTMTDLSKAGDTLGYSAFIYRHHVLSTASGSTVKHTSPSRIGSFEFATGNANILNAFEKLVIPIHGSIQNRNSESRTLGALRDTLLPKLISGELPIKNAEKFLEQAGV